MERGLNRTSLLPDEEVSFADLVYLTTTGLDFQKGESEGLRKTEGAPSWPAMEKGPGNATAEEDDGAPQIPTCNPILLKVVILFLKKGLRRTGTLTRRLSRKAIKNKAV